MLTLITGKPGDGKTLYACREIVRVLRDTDFYVVTDVPLIMGRLREYVNEGRGDDEQIDLDERLRVINPEEAHSYWRYRSGGLVLDPSPDAACKDDGPKRMAKMDFDLWARKQFERLAEKPEYQRGVYYVIDEAHEKFPARDWQSIGRIVTYHASKHRHLHDEVWLLTQAPDFLDKTLRSLVSESRVTRNNLRRNVGPFKLRGVFKVRHFYGVPSGPSLAPFSVEEMSLDAAGLASCYQTVGAFGVHSKPEELVNKGRFPWWSLWVLAVGGILALGFLVFVLPQLLLRKVGKDVFGVPDTPAAVSSSGAGSGGLGYLMHPVDSSPVSAPGPVQVVPESVVIAPRVVGVVSRDGAAWAVCEDGTTLFGVDGQRPGQVRIDGRWLPIQGRPVSEEERRRRDEERTRAEQWEAASAVQRERGRQAMIAEARAVDQAARADAARWSARVAPVVRTQSDGVGFGGAYRSASVGSPGWDSPVVTSQGPQVLTDAQARQMGLHMLR